LSKYITALGITKDYLIFIVQAVVSGGIEDPKG
jgi:hypothetical protein